MNILEICLAPALGGLELYFHRCCVELRARGHRVVSVRLAGSRLEELGKRDGVTVLPMTKGNKFLPLRNARHVAFLIAEHKIDIVHAHHKDDLPLLALAKRFARRSFRLVFTRQMPMKQTKKDPYHRWIYGKVDLFITITEKLRLEAIEKLPVPSSRITRLYYGVPAPPQLDRPFLEHFLSISQPGDFNIGIFSRQEFQKGQHTLIAAMKMLVDRRIPARLYIVGDVMFPEYHKVLVDAIADNQLKDRVVFKGFLQEPVRAMMGVDALVLPSRNEAFGLVLIEAMRCGVVVLGVNAGGVPEIIDHNETGLLFEWENSNQLADELEHLYRDPAFRTKLATSGKEKADRLFNSENHFRDLELLFANVMANR